MLILEGITAVLRHRESEQRHTNADALNTSEASFAIEELSIAGKSINSASSAFVSIVDVDASGENITYKMPKIQLD